MKDPDCGGCKGQGAHSRRCRTNPGWFWYRLQDMADELADSIGSNDPAAANMAYAIAGRMKARAEGKASEEYPDDQNAREHAEYTRRKYLSDSGT